MAKNDEDDDPVEPDGEEADESGASSAPDAGSEARASAKNGTLRARYARA